MAFDQLRASLPTEILVFVPPASLPTPVSSQVSVARSRLIDVRTGGRRRNPVEGLENNEAALSRVVDAPEKLG